MGKLGRPIAGKEKRIEDAILDSLGEDVPGKTLKQLAVGVKPVIDRSTIWRHLGKFVALGLVIHEGKFYRKNPLYGEHMRYGVKTRIRHVKGKLQKQTRQEVDANILRSLSVVDWFTNPRWRPKDLLQDDLPEFDFADPDDLFRLLEAIIREALNGYLSVLEIVRQTRDFSRAREIANLTFDAEVKRSLLSFARVVWMMREVVHFEKLNGREMKFSLEEPASMEGSNPSRGR